MHFTWQNEIVELRKDKEVISFAKPVYFLKISRK